MGRLQLRRVQRGVLPWVIACWALTLAVIVALLWPGALAGIDGEPVASADGLLGFVAPLWFRVVVTTSTAVLVGALIVIVALSPRPEHVSRIPNVLAQVAIATSTALPGLVLLADRAWFFALAAVLVIAAVQVALRMSSRPLVPALLGSLTWTILAAYQLTEPAALRESWVWIVLFGLAAAFAAFGAYYGVARAAESRSRALRFLFRERWHPLAVLAVVLAASVLLVLRMTLLRELFPDPDPVLWAPWDRSPVSWALAGIVAVVLVVVAVRSARRPLLRIGQRRVTAALAVLGNLQLVVAAGLIVIGMVAAIFGGADLPHEWSEAVPVLKVVGVIALGLVMALPMLRGTAARWLGVVAALFLVPQTLASAFAARGVALPGWLTGFQPSPVQVTMMLVGTALVLAVANLAGARIRPSLVARFAIVPIVAVHAGWLLPAVWTQFGIVVAVIGVVIGLVLFQPVPSKDSRVHSARVLTTAAAQLLGLGVALVAAPSLLDDPSLIVLGLVWLSVVVVAALCFETRDRADHAR
jgi:hypothetical protein